MAKQNDLLTIQDINSFVERLYATMAAAEENQALKAALGRLVSSGSGGLTFTAATTPRTAAATGEGKGARSTSRNGKAAKAPATPGAAPSHPSQKKPGKRGRKARVSNQEILDLVKNAANGIRMRDLESQLKQHPETIRLKLRDLRRQGLVTTSGPRNQLRYFAANAKAAATTTTEAPAVKAAGQKTSSKNDQKSGKATGKRGRKAGKAKGAKPGRKPAAAAAQPAQPPQTPKAAKAGPKGKGKAAKAGATNGATNGLGEKVLGAIRGGGTGGVAMNALATGLKADPKIIRKAIEGLVQGGTVKVTGNRRSTRYHAAN